MLFFQLFTFGFVYSVCKAQDHFTCSRIDDEDNPTHQINTIKSKLYKLPKYIH